MHAPLEQNAEAAVIRLEGRLTFAESSEFRRVVETLEQSGSGQVVIDLEHLEFIDTAGMGLLLVARDASARQGGSVRLAGAGGQVARMLRLARFADYFTVDRECAQV